MMKWMEADQSENRTLKIIFHGRSIHEGKCFKEEFYFALGWLFDKHPRTLLDK